MELKQFAASTANDHVLGLSWSADGERLAAAPSEGPILVLNRQAALVGELSDHGLGNGAAVFHPDAGSLATCGTDGCVRLYDDVSPFARPVEISLGKGWIERLGWSPDGRHLATAIGKRLVILDAGGAPVCEFGPHKSSVCDFAWNPREPREITSVCDGGAHLWRLGHDAPFARFDWGGASLLAKWSPDGRWVVTGDQTPSVHLYDLTRDYPLHIQGYETKVKALAFNSASRKLATGGGKLVTLWTCTGKTGPEGTIPRQLQGHTGDCLALAYRPGSDWLASGGVDGRLILFEPDSSAQPRASQRLGSAVTCVAWHPRDPLLALGTEAGEIVLVEVA
ncbi:MAG: WD40 repeat domain-containing protein [Terrimicrobiaceae bacterium]|nr:WD40 repeat domain-containing protein [Terrimicrobiaceae bacterium]